MAATLSPVVTARLWVAAFVVSTFGIGLANATGIIHGWPATLLFLASFLLLLPMVRATERSAAEQGNISAAMRRYNRRVIVTALGYVAALFIGVTLVKQFDPPTIVRILLAIAVAVPVLGMIRAMALLLREETDEYLRSRLVQQSLTATGFMLTIATLYGFLNTFDVAPRVDAWAVFPLWAIGLGLGRLIQKDPSC